VGNRDSREGLHRRHERRGLATSLFIDPEPAQIELGAQLGAPWIELHTGAYCARLFHAPARRGIRPLGAGTKLGRHAAHGQRRHGINYVNIAEVRTLPGLHEAQHRAQASSVAPSSPHRRAVAK